MMMPVAVPAPGMPAVPALALLLLACILPMRCAASTLPAGIVAASVREFGAVGDGKTDDIEAIEKALAAVRGGGTVFFPSPGAYAVSRAVLVTGQSITLRGGGMTASGCKDRGSSLVALDPANSTLVVIEHCTNCGVLHLGLHGRVSCEGPAMPATEIAAAAVRARAGSRLQRMQQPAAAAAWPVASADRGTQPAAVPTNGAAVAIRASFQVTLSYLWIADAFVHIAVSEFANTITVADLQLSNAYGPCSICAAGGISEPVGLPSANKNGTRVDILQITRLTANNDASANSSVVWLDIGGGVNTVRLDNVGLINGGTGVRMASPATNPAGLYPGRPLFLLANDLEIDYPSGNAVELLEGEEVQISNGYIQGAGAKILVDRRQNDSSLGVGVLVGPNFDSEIMITNTRFFGHALQAVEIGGGKHTVISTCVITENSIAVQKNASGVLVKAGVSGTQLQACSMLISALASRFLTLDSPSLSLPLTPSCVRVCVWFGPGADSPCPVRLRDPGQSYRCRRFDHAETRR
jgi:hypothetical protein